MMSNIFTDLSPEALHKISMEQFIASFTCFAGVPGVEVVESEAMIRLVSPGIPNWLTNTVLRCRFPAAQADGLIDETTAYFRARGVRPHWRLCPGDRPADLEARLVAKGHVAGEEQIAMAVDLEKVNQRISSPTGLVIERVTDAATMQEKHGWLNRLGTGQSLGTLLLDLFTAVGFADDSVWQHYLADLNGETVAWASVFYAAGAAGIYAVGTRPEARRQGIGSAITLRALRDAHQRGYRIGLLQSSQMGYNVYRKLGFEPCFAIKAYAPANS
jgi:GNAT superfamily N-acetyltransferase